MACSKFILIIFAVLLVNANVQNTFAQRKPPPKTAPAASAASLDGQWTGKTLQGQIIAFAVVKGKITSFTFGGRFSGAGCSTTSTTTTTINKAILNRAFSFSAFAGPGGSSVAVNGKFTNATTVQGSASMVLHSIPGPPPGVPGYVPSCGGSVNTKWAAIKGDAPPPDVRALLAATTTTKRAGPPLLSMLSPKESDVLDNGCSNLEEPINWEFTWTAAKGASLYHLYVIHETASNPVIDKQDITGVSYTNSSKGLIPEQNLEGWLWKVRPMVNGVWKAWSEDRRFDVENENRDCDDWRDALKKAANSGDEAKLKELLSLDWVNAPKTKEMKRYALSNALGDAVKTGKVPIVRLLLESGADAGASSGYHETVLKAAIAAGNVEIVRLLLDKGASAATDRMDDNPPLYMACERGLAEIVKLLLQKGSNPNQDGFGFKKPIIAAVKSGSIETVRTMMEAKADPNAREFAGDTALGIAASRGYKEIAALLRQFGAHY